jgi:sigma-B regulation protein RsbU (phosphoserine phosphatase)
MMKISRRIMPAGLLLRRCVRYLLASRGFRIIEAAGVLTALGFVLTGSRIAAIDRLGSRADIVTTIVATVSVIALLRAVNRRVLAAIDRTADEEVIRRELETAWEVQRNLFPAGGLEDAALELYGTCLPARWVGGDYYDYFAVGRRRVAVAVADVAGKGVAAALLMTTVQALLRSQLTSGARRLTDVVATMNRLLRRSMGAAGYVTFFLAEFEEETGRLTYVNAGHNPPMLLRPRITPRGKDRTGFQGEVPLRPHADARLGEKTLAVGTVKEEAPVALLTVGGPIIGTFLDGPYEQGSVQVEGGDVLVAYTDGVTEALSPEGLEFGEERLRSVAVQWAHLPARELVEKVMAGVLEWQGEAAQHDDITLVVAKVRAGRRAPLSVAPTPSPVVPAPAAS